MTMRSPRRAGAAGVEEAGLAEGRDVPPVALLVVFLAVAVCAVAFGVTPFFAGALGVAFFVGVCLALALLAMFFFAGTVCLLEADG